MTDGRENVNFFYVKNTIISVKKPVGELNNDVIWSFKSFNQNICTMGNTPQSNSADTFKGSFFL